ncbi:MAG: DoxX family membrane protein [Ignavibacteriales bacterium]|nr:DoxX family membrane protein [Ignavibacteriales bacterium]
MKSVLSNDYLVLAARVFIGFVFVFASVDKVAQPDEFAISIDNYKLLTDEMATLTATVLPWVELLSGLGILAGVYFRGTSLLASMMSLIFVLAVGSALARGLDISCGCFSQDPNVGKINWEKIVQNILLVGFSLYLLYSTSDRFKLEHLLRRSTPKDSPE